MKKTSFVQLICGLAIISTLFCCSKRKNVTEEQIIENNAITKENDGIASLTNNAEMALPVQIPFSEEQLKSISWDETDKELEIFLYIDENIGNEWWGDDVDDDQYWGKYFIAELYNLENLEKNISKLNEEEQEEIKSDERWDIVTNNRTLFKNLHYLFQCLADEENRAKIHLRSKNGMSKVISLTSDEVKDAVVYSLEILEKVDRDHYADAF